METTTAKSTETRAAKHAALLKKYGKPKPLSKKEAAEVTGIWKDNPKTLEELREKAWRRK